MSLCAQVLPKERKVTKTERNGGRRMVLAESTFARGASVRESPSLDTCTRKTSKHAQAFVMAAPTYREK
jgi:hypothetical protein